MNTKIILNSSNINFSIEDYNYNKYENVISYNYHSCSPILEIQVNPNAHLPGELINKTYYYIFDSPGKCAFGHWIFESFIFINFFLRIKALYPDIIIITKNNKKYVKNFFNFFIIENKIENEITNPNNICFFSPILSLNDNNIDQIIYKKEIEKYINSINNKILSINFLLKKDIIFLPRNTKDNSLANDRVIVNSEEISNMVIEFGGTSLNTYDINNFSLQFSIINSFNTIILDFGSSYFVNCIHLSNKKIIVIDNFGYTYQIKTFVSLNILNQIISSKNQVIFLQPDNGKNVTIEQIKKYL